MSSSIYSTFHSFKVKFVILPHFPDHQQPLLPKCKRRNIFSLLKVYVKRLELGKYLLKRLTHIIKIEDQNMSRKCLRPTTDSVVWAVIHSSPQVQKHFWFLWEPINSNFSWLFLLTSFVYSLLSNLIVPTIVQSFLITTYQQYSLFLHHTLQVSCKGPTKIKLSSGAMTWFYLLSTLGPWLEVTGDH